MFEYNLETLPTSQIFNPVLDRLLKINTQRQLPSPSQESVSRTSYDYPIKIIEFEDGVTVSQVGRAGEDRHLHTSFIIRGQVIKLYGIFDGHGGKDIVEQIIIYLPPYLEKSLNQINIHDPKSIYRAIEAAYIKLDTDLYTNGYTSGSTASIALVINNVVYVANLGDSKSIIYSPKYGLLLATLDHKPNRADEKDRIHKIGGEVIQSDVYRVAGTLAISRAFGDFYLKRISTSEEYNPRGWISVIPTIHTHYIKYNDEYLILATDGIWDGITVDNLVTDLIVSNDRSYMKQDTLGNILLKCRHVTDDDITITQVKLKLNVKI